MRRPPPWWPEGEPFPPRRRHWGRGPAPFIRFVGCLFLVVVLVAITTGALAGFLLHSGGAGMSHPFFLPLVILIGLIVIAVAGGARRMAMPLNNLIEAARRIESGDYSARVPEWGSPDLRSVARAFNSMSERLKTSDEQRRSFLADVTHELRTPLAVIRGHAEAIADGVYPADASHLAPILDATETLDRLVDDLRTLVLTDAGNLVLHKETTELGALVRDTVSSFHAQAEAAGVSLTSEVADNVSSVEVDPARMRQVIGNLVSNAVRHTPSGGSVQVVLSAAGDRVMIAVKDDGEGIPAELLPHIFERFVKGANSKGSGLGLAIAHDIVVAHGGTIRVGTRVGSGTTMEVALPT